MFPPEEYRFLAPEEFFEYITPEDLEQVLRHSKHEMQFVDPSTMDIPRDVIQKVSSNMARVYKLIPVAYHSNILTVAISDPENVNALDD